MGRALRRDIGGRGRGARDRTGGDRLGLHAGGAWRARQPCGAAAGLDRRQDGPDLDLGAFDELRPARRLRVLRPRR
jgi:hypothetical protein